jgi:hypothetical protein
MPFAGDFLPGFNPGEVQPFSLDFAPQIANVAGDAILHAVVTVETLEQEADPNAAALLQGVPIVTGTVVTQWFGGSGLPCVVYSLIYTVITTAGRTLVNSAHATCNAIR